MKAPENLLNAKTAKEVRVALSAWMNTREPPITGEKLGRISQMYEERNQST